MRCVRPIVLLGVLCVSHWVACAESLVGQSRSEIGVRVDAPLHGPIVKSSSLYAECRCGPSESSPRHVSFGFSISVPIVPRMRLRLDPGYQRIGVTETGIVLLYQGGADSPVGVLIGKTGTTANRWRVPVLLETELSRHVRLGIGPVLSLLTGSRTAVELRISFRPEMLHTDPFRHPVSAELLGIAAAVEFPFRLGRVTMAPEVRYTRWTGKHYGGIWAMDEVTTGLALRL